VVWLFPAVTVIAVGITAVPIPETAIVCVEAVLPSALSVNVMLPLNGPLPVGEKATAITHDPPGTSVDVPLQSVKPLVFCTNPAGIASPVSVKGWFPTFVTATFCAAVDFPGSVVANVSDVAVETTLRRALFPVSATNKFANWSIASPIVAFNVAAVDRPESPV